MLTFVQWFSKNEMMSLPIRPPGTANWSELVSAAREIIQDLIGLQITLPVLESREIIPGLTSISWPTLKKFYMLWK